MEGVYINWCRSGNAVAALANCRNHGLGETLADNPVVVLMLPIAAICVRWFDDGSDHVAVRVTNSNIAGRKMSKVNADTTKVANELARHGPPARSS